ncbi:MAG: hypothetical protein ACTSXK_14215 [Promethearchaeota archaeon]
MSKKIKYFIFIILLANFLLSYSTMTQAINSSAEWSVSKDDVYYVIWIHHPLVTGKYELATPDSPLYEKVIVNSIGPALAMHENPPTSYFEHSVNVSGYKWSGTTWDEISPGETTQLSIWNSSNEVWFCGGLFFGAPVIAPKNYADTNRENTIKASAEVLWSGSISETYNTSATPTRWTFTNGTYSLTVGYESNGFLDYYQLIVGSNTYECTIQTSEPTLPSPSESESESAKSSQSEPNIASYPILIFSIISLGTILVIFRKNDIVKKYAKA